MLDSSATYEDAVGSSVNLPIAKVVVDFGAGPVDVTTDVVKVQSDRALETNIPEQARLTEGFASAAATITLGEGTPGEPASHKYSPYVKNYTLGEPVTVDVGFTTSAGDELLRIFTGTLESVEVSSMGQVILEALDNRASMRSLYLPVLDNTTETGEKRHGLDGHHLMGRLVRPLGYNVTPPSRAGVRLNVPFTGSNHAIENEPTPQVAYAEHVRGPYGEALRPSSAPRWAADPVISLVHPYAVDMEGWFNTGGMTSLDLMAVGYHDPTVVNEDRIEIEIYSDGRLAGWVKRWDSGTGTRTDEGFYLSNGAIGAGWHYIAARFIPHSDGTYRWWARVYGHAIDETNFADGNNPSEGGAVSTTGSMYFGHSPQLGSAKMPSMSACLIHAISDVTDSEPTWWNHKFAPNVDLDPSLLRLDAVAEAGTVDGWEVCQDLAGAELGVFGFDESGEPFFKNIHWPYEQTTPVKTVTATDASTIQAELSTSNVYDKITVTGRRFTKENADRYYWTAQDKYRLDGNLVINADAGRPIAVTDTGEKQLTTNTADARQDGTAYRANTEKDGSGTDVAVNLTFEPNATGTVVKCADNPGGSTGVGYLVGTSGAPALWIYGHGFESTGRITETVGSGRRELTLASTDWRQDPDNLRPALLRLHSDLSTPHAVITDLDVWPDPRLQLTDLVTVQDTTGLGLNANFHITATSLTFSAGELRQTIELRAALGLFEPSDISGLTAHFDARDPFGNGSPPPDGTAISMWTNLVDGTTITQSTSSKQPIWRANQTLAGHPAIQFDGVDDTLGGSASVDGTKTIVAAYQTSRTPTSYGDFVGGGTWTLNFQGPDDPTPVINYWSGAPDSATDYFPRGPGFIVVTVQQIVDESTIWVNGRFQRFQAGHNNTGATTDLAVGSNVADTNFAGVDAAAVFIWNRALADDERQQVEQWIGHTYGISIGK